MCYKILDGESFWNKVQIIKAYNYILFLARQNAKCFIIFVNSS